MRERPARKDPPTSPTFSVSPRSSALCTSSSPAFGRNFPEATSEINSRKPASIFFTTSSVNKAELCRTLKWASDERKSYGARHQSKSTLRESAKTASAGASENRPPQSAIIFSPSDYCWISFLIYRMRAILSLIPLRRWTSWIQLKPCRHQRLCR